MFTELYQFVIEQLGKNDLIAGGAILGVLAYVLNQLRTIPATLLRWSRLLFVTHMDIPDRAEAFEWVNDWLAQHPYSKKSKRITVEVHGGHSKITPAPGKHLIWWGKQPIILERVRREGTGDNAHRAFRESWKITLIGRRNQIEKFIEDCRGVFRREIDNSIYIREVTSSNSLCTNESIRRPKRSLDSVLCPAGVSERLMEDIHSFIDSKTWYNEMCIPWRRGYLLSGPPGNGKSSLIKAVASEIDFKVVSMNVNCLGDSTISDLVWEVEKNCIILLEDIDCIFDGRAAKSSLSMSSLLNMLDGVATSEGWLVFMTTNHPEKLDPALVRPGRIDLHIDLPNPTRDQIARLFDRFFPKVQFRNESYDPAGIQFAKLVEGKGISMAKLQGYLLQHRHRAGGAMNNIKDLIE